MNVDIAIVGAGPTGLMAAIHAGKQGARVLLIERAEYLRTLAIAGNRPDSRGPEQAGRGSGSCPSHTGATK